MTGHIEVYRGEEDGETQTILLVGYKTCKATDLCFREVRGRGDLRKDLIIYVKQPDMRPLYRPKAA